MPKPKTKNAGRPKLAKGEAKGGKIQVRLNPEEQRKIELAAKASKQSISDWVRSKLNATLQG